MSPKEAFAKGPHKENHRKWAESASAEVARDAALLEFVMNQPDGSDLAKGWDAHSQLVGAKRILGILFNLHLQEEPPKPTRLTTLRPPS